MAVITIKLLDSELRGAFYVSKDPIALAQMVRDRYVVATPFVDSTVEGEAAAEEAFDLTNNPSRQDERELKYGRGRSVSVGDIIGVDGVDYLCMSCGWESLPAQA